LLQYETLWHFRHCFSESGDLVQWAHVGVGGAAVADEEDDASGGDDGVVVGGEDVAVLSVDDGSAIAGALY
jgi:hypothetical protein